VSGGLGPDDLMIDSGMLQSAGFRRRASTAAHSGRSTRSSAGRGRDFFETADAVGARSLGLTAVAGRAAGSGWPTPQ
jgi:hypothetical protein